MRPSRAVGAGRAAIDRWVLCCGQAHYAGVHTSNPSAPVRGVRRLREQWERRWCKRRRPVLGGLLIRPAKV